MISSQTLICCIVLSEFIFSSTARSFLLTDVKCRNMDDKFLNVTKCELKPTATKSSVITVNVTLFDIIRTGAVKLKFLRKSNMAYNVYMYRESTIDSCKFLKQRKSQPLINYLFSFMESFSNINHSCPYKDYVVVDRFNVDANKLALVPIPSGDYAFASKWFCNGKERLQIDAYFTFTE